MPAVKRIGLICFLLLVAGCNSSCNRTRGQEKRALSNPVVATTSGGAAADPALAGSTKRARQPSIRSSRSGTGWLRTEKNKILTEDGNRFHGRGANIFDTRQCGSCGWAPPRVGEVVRRVDELVDNWHANFLRLPLTSFSKPEEKGISLVQWGDVTQDESYFEHVKAIVDHIGSKPGVYVLVSLFKHPALDAHGLPTGAATPVYKKLAEAFRDSPHVLFGVSNEPHDTTNDAVWTAMNQAVQVFRDSEPASGPHHLVAVQGTQDYARSLDYYLGRRIQAGDGKNVIYETHVYNHTFEWQSLFISPSSFLPMIIGEYGPATGYMTLEDSKGLMVKAEELEVPYIAWSFSPECVPGLLATADNPTDCGEGLPLVPSEWGKLLKERLTKAW